MTPPTTSTRAARSREKLLRAATDLLVDAGPRAVTVDAVAERSGVAKSTLYRHWPSRDEMLVDVVRCNIPELAAVDLSLGFEAALRAHLRGAADALRSPEWSRIVPALMMLRGTMPELAAVAQDDQSAKRSQLAAIVELGVAEGVLVGGLDADSAMALLYGPLVFATITDSEIDLDRLADLVVDRLVAAGTDS